jgi:hypothetical protein
MKLTVITDEAGAIVGAMQGHVERPDVTRPGTKTGEFHAGLAAGPGQRLQEIEAPDALGKVTDPNEFGKQLTQLMKGKAGRPAAPATVR